MRRATAQAPLVLAFLLTGLAWLACGGEHVSPGWWSAQLHVHGSFSEGVGSIDSHSFEARDVGVDVIWWSDHDWRIGSYRSCSTFSFDDSWEAVDEDEPWSIVSPDELSRRAGIHQKGIGPTRWTKGRARDGTDGRCLEVAAEGRVPASSAQYGEDRDYYMLELWAPKDRFYRPVAAGLTLHLDVHPDRADADARPAVRIQLSRHAPREEAGEEVYALHYYLSEEAEEPHRDGTTYVVPVHCRVGEWNEITLSVTRDAQRGFPFVEGEDNRMGPIALGVEVQNGATASARFDSLRIEQELSGQAALAKHAEVVAKVAEAYPGLRQLQGLEISYLQPHLNEFSRETRLFDYDGVFAEHRGQDMKELSAAVARAIVERAHAEGSLISYNHLFGAGMAEREEGIEVRTREEVLVELVETRLYGADLLEVGYRDRGGHDLRDHLWVWDRLAEHGLFPVGTGVSDSHGARSQGWRDGVNNFVSWIEAPAPTKADLIEGLRAGRVFLGDIVLFDGSLDLVTERGFRMGDVVLTDRDGARVELRVDGLAGDETMRWVGAEGAGPAVDPSEPFAVELAGRDRAMARVEVHAADGRAMVFSNPIHFLRSAPEGGIPAPRAALDVAGVRGTDARDLILLGARRAATGGLEIDVQAEGGSLHLGLDESEGRPEVTFDGLSGEWSAEGGELALSGLTGRGRILVRVGR